MSTTDHQLLTDLQYALVEPPDEGANWPSGLWRREEVISGLNFAQNSFLKDTLLLVKVASGGSALPVAIGQHRVTLPTDWLRTVTVVWRGNGGTIRELQRLDAFEVDHLLTTWETTNALPFGYMDTDAPATLEVQIAPAPTEAGVLELWYVPSGTTMEGNGTAILLADEFRDAVKYGTLTSLLKKDGRGRDLDRATYAASRVDFLVEAARMILEGWS